MKRTANAHWNGTLKEGKGEISPQSITGINLEEAATAASL